ncbi:hypothetical protein OUZ56_002870 [Daphnia magna]|uniref:Uncharacterized protein n=1 Tax=Daphnia magna TaxID=35525 RepID=A0ABR0A723_9CRUS|nr:hypothetical protein OUZ56_002870 [Daphnia magna]
MGSSRSTKSLSPIFFLFLFYTCGVVTASAYDKNSTKNPIDSHYTRAQQERLRPPVSTMAIKDAQKRNRICKFGKKRCIRGRAYTTI